MQKTLTKLLPPLPSGLRAPKRSTLDALHGLSAWLPRLAVETFVADDAYPDQLIPSDWPGVKPDILLQHRRQIDRWKSGWAAAEIEMVQPMPATFLVTKTLESLLNPEKTRLRAVKLKQARIWVGQCATCKKHTLGLSTYFLQGGCCLHCGTARNAGGINGSDISRSGFHKFLAGTYPLNGQIHLLSAKNLEQAQALSLEKGYAWVVSLHTAKKIGAKSIPLPSAPAPDRPKGAWSFPLDDFPEDWEQVSEPWEGPAGENLAWFKPWFAEQEQTYTTETPAKPAPPTISFDDFM